MTVYAGICRGGPYTLRRMVHHEAERVIWCDAYTRKAIPGMVGPSSKHPGATVGRYRWDAARSEWDWQEGT